MKKIIHKFHKQQLKYTQNSPEVFSIGFNSTSSSGSGDSLDGILGRFTYRGSSDAVVYTGGFNNDR